MLPAIRRPRGRPKGANYSHRDLPRHKEMRDLIENEGLSLAQAAWEVAPRAYPPTSERASKARRLATTYPHKYPPTAAGEKS
jgi:hypothetical protein